MTTDEFWKIVDDARASDGNREVDVSNVRRTLEGLSVDSILGFEKELQTRMAESYRWDLWAVAYIVNGGCSDDGFDYFRGWLISKGRAYYETALQDAERAADDAEPDANECEDILYVAASSYKAKTSAYPTGVGVKRPSDPVGTPWDEDDLAARYPKLWERFSK